MLRLALLLALIPGCKSMGGVASGLGHVASAASKVAAPVARASVAVTRATLPIAANIASGMANASVGGTSFGPDPAPSEPVVSMGGPLIDNHDPCNACPDNLACGACLGNADQVCQWSPAGAYTRCESSVP
jgi:hypothetical protein